MEKTLLDQGYTAEWAKTYAQMIGTWMHDTGGAGIFWDQEAAKDGAKALAKESYLSENDVEAYFNEHYLELGYAPNQYENFKNTYFKGRNFLSKDNI